MERHSWVSLVALAIAGVVQPACARQQSAASEASYRVVEAFPNLTFKRPTDLQSPRDGTNRLFVLEQDGVIRVFPNRADAKESTVFLDLRDRVNKDGNEMGLLGLAFHPQFKTNPVFFVDYTATKEKRRITRVSRFGVAQGGVGDAHSEDAVIEIDQPWANHNGGQVAFGPDGMLYIALGDGGAAGDPHGNAQNPDALLGKLLRLDVSKSLYATPADNPFHDGKSGRPEIYAMGLRNPWRFSFDRQTGQLWAGDVGQNTYEEIDIIEKGKNYGWDCREAAHSFDGEQSERCENAQELVDPVWEYGRKEGISVTGGYVYRGKALPDLVGWYVYADYGSGKVWALRMENGKSVNRLLVESGLLISTFGVDENDELYLCAHNPGNEPTKIYRLEAK
ncbi:MAG TPA: PQQ-dependent sugar dehydrogenase [Candidatus Krumholzibacteria bacterium]